VRRPRRPVRLTRDEDHVVRIALTFLVNNSRLTNKFTEGEYQAWLGLLSHLNAGHPLYKLGYSYIPPAQDPDS